MVPICTEDSCTGGGGGGLGGSDPTFTVENSGMTTTGYTNQNYAEGYDANGSLFAQYYIQGDVSSPWPYQFVGSNGTTVSGTGPASSSIPSDVNYVYGSIVVYIDSAAETATILDQNENRTYTLSFNASGDLVISTPGAPDSVVPNSVLVSEGLAYRDDAVFVAALNCKHAVLAATAATAIIFGASIFIVGAGCAVTAGVGCGAIGWLTYLAAVVAISNVSKAAAKDCGVGG